MLATLLTPIACAIAVLLIALLAAACTLPKGDRGLLSVALRPETCTLQLWLLLLFFPSVTRTALTPFDCVEVGEASLMRSNPATSCDDAEWRVLAALAGIATVVYSLGFPLLCYLLTRHESHGVVSTDPPTGADAALAENRAANATDRNSRSTPPVDASVAGLGSTAKLAEPSATGVEESRLAAEEASAMTVGSKGGGRVERSKRRAKRGRARLLLRSYHASYWYWESVRRRPRSLCTYLLHLAPIVLCWRVAARGAAQVLSDVGGARAQA